MIANRALGCLPLGELKLRRGPVTVTSGTMSRVVHFPTDRAQLLAYYRSVPDVENFGLTKIKEWLPRMFPDLYFHRDAWNHVKGLSRPLKELRTRILRHLAALNDHFQDCLEQMGGDTKKTIKRFRAMTQVQASPESRKTHRNRAAMKKRLLEVDGQDVYMEWHTKLNQTTDRIHFYPGRERLVSGRLIVGYIGGHLPT